MDSYFSDKINVPNRKQMRLKDYDYSQSGIYFVTICTYNKECLLGEIIVGQGLCSCRLSKIGKIVESEIHKLLTRYPDINIPKFIIMPNHVHILLEIFKQEPCQRQEQSPCPTVGDIMCSLKSLTTKQSNKCNNNPGKKIWQYRYHDRILRNEQEYQNIWEYIDTNPQKWAEDYYYTK